MAGFWNGVKTTAGKGAAWSNATMAAAPAKWERFRLDARYFHEDNIAPALKWGKNAVKVPVIAAAGAGLAIAGAAWLMKSRNQKTFKPSDVQPLPLPEVVAPMPMAAPQMDMQGAPTLMGQPLVTDGPIAQRVRGLDAAGPGNPPLGDLDGTGQAPQALGRGI